MELGDLRRKLERLQAMQSEKEGAPGGADEVEEESEDDEDDYDDDVGELPKSKPNAKGNKPRGSVSAECFGDWNKKEDFEAPVIPKNDESKNKI